MGDLEMTQSQVVRRLVASAGAAILLACGPLAAQVTSPGNNKPLPQGAQNAPAHQGGGSVDLAPLLARIGALEDKVRKLEGRLTEAEVVGTYRLGYLQTSIRENTTTGNASQIENNINWGTLTLRADRTASYVGREIGFATNLPGPAERRERGRNPDEFSADWSYSGSVLTLTVIGDSGEPESVDFAGAVGGRMFFTVTASPTAVDGTTTLIVLIKDL
jgi:hypothetical protein